MAELAANAKLSVALDLKTSASYQALDPRRRHGLKSLLSGRRASRDTDPRRRWDRPERGQSMPRESAR
jgi:hypothetical protein